MGCSWFSVFCLPVLIMTSFLANTQTYAPEITTTNAKTTIDSTELSNRSLVSADQQTTGQVITVGTSDSQYNCSSNYEFQDIEGEHNSSVSQNCTYLITTPVSRGDKRTYRDFLEYKQYKNLQVYFPYITTVPGFITNTLTIFVAMKIKPMHTCELYMIVLGFADLLTVTSKFINRIIAVLSDNRFSWECKLLSYTYTVSPVFSNLLLMFWTVERFIAVTFPMKLAAWCSIRNTKIALGVLFIFCIAFSVPFLTENEAVVVWNGQKTINVCNMSEFIFLLWVHIESVYYIYIPITVVAVCNVVILHRLNSMMKARISMASNKEIIDKKAQENKRMTVLLLSISATFLLLHIPYIIALVINYIYPDITVLLIDYPHDFAKVLLYSNVCVILTEFQNCINFFLYCLSGSKFRSTFRRLFCKCIAVEKMDNTLQSSKTVTTKI